LQLFVTEKDGLIDTMAARTAGSRPPTRFMIATILIAAHARYIWAPSLFIQLNQKILSCVLAINGSAVGKFSCPKVHKSTQRFSSSNFNALEPNSGI
jgi:hypothetical protein